MTRIEVHYYWTTEKDGLVVPKIHTSHTVLDLKFYLYIDIYIYIYTINHTRKIKSWTDVVESRDVGTACYISSHHHTSWQGASATKLVNPQAAM